jgi:hypothetical protein
MRSVIHKTSRAGDKRPYVITLLNYYSPAKPSYITLPLLLLTQMQRLCPIINFSDGMYAVQHGSSGDTL